jgi:uncharacterized protein (DUF1778 family)
MTRKETKIDRETPYRVERLGFRLDEETKGLIERAAYLSRRKVTDFCVTALTDTARRTIAEHETMVLSDRDRRAFFEALVQMLQGMTTRNANSNTKGATFKAR